MKKGTNDPVTKPADAALRQAARNVIKRASRSGAPVILREDGKATKVDPRKLNKKAGK